MLKNNKKKTHLSPHDRYLRSIMMNPRVIKDFFEKNLPAPIRLMVDLNTLEPQKESFINDKLRLQVADLLYSVTVRGERGYIYLLLEHASKPDRLLPFRMLKYMTAVMDYHLSKTGNATLPIVYPLILYTGKQTFNHSLDLFDLFEENRSIARDIYMSPYQLIDLSHLSDEELAQYHWFRVAALFAKHIHDKDMLPFLREIMVSLRELENSGELEYIYLSVSYVVEAGEVSDKDEFFHTITKGLAHVDEDKIMTIAEQLRKEGFEQAMAIAEQLKKESLEQTMAIAERLKKESLEQTMAIAEQLKKEGFAQGAEEKAILIAQNMVANNISVDLITKVTGISTEILERFKH